MVCVYAGRVGDVVVHYMFIVMDSGLWFSHANATGKKSYGCLHSIFGVILTVIILQHVTRWCGRFRRSVDIHRFARENQ